MIYYFHYSFEFLVQVMIFPLEKNITLLVYSKGKRVKFEGIRQEDLEWLPTFKLWVNFEESKKERKKRKERKENNNTLAWISFTRGNWIPKFSLQNLFRYGPNAKTTDLDCKFITFLSELLISTDLIV